MKSLKKIRGLVAAIVILALILLLHKSLGKTLISANIFFKSFFDRSFNYEEYQKLLIENRTLKEEIKKLNTKNNKIAESEKFEYKEIETYSNYPFNDKNVIIINFGEKEGAKNGMPVILGNMIVGQIEKTNNTQSNVQTIFDNKWVNSVEIGENKISALFKGGLPPSLEFVSRDAKINPDDIIYNTSSNLPLGFVMGYVKNAEKGEGRFWSKILVKPSLNIDEIKKIRVILNYP